jgi:hypothetical protein
MEHVGVELEARISEGEAREKHAGDADADAADFQTSEGEAHDADEGEDEDALRGEIGVVKKGLEPFHEEILRRKERVSVQGNLIMIPE